MSNNSSIAQDKSASSGHDKYAPGTVDVTDPSGRRLDLQDDVLEGAIGAVGTASRGAVPKKKKRLPQRIEEGEFAVVQDDPSNLPVDEETTDNDENPFVDEDTDQNDTNVDEDSVATDVPQVAQGPISNPLRTIGDPTTWIVEALKTIHQDLQVMKPLLSNIPDINKKLHEIQLSLGETASSITEMGNRITNMEKTLTLQRSDINKLTDLFLTHVKVPAEMKQPIPQVIQQKISPTAETNITRMVEVISKKKNLTGDQEVILRNLISTKDKDIIVASLRDLGVKRTIMSAEIDQIVQMDYGTSRIMNDALKTLTSLIPLQQTSGCPPDCPMMSEQTSLAKSVGRRPNPYSFDKSKNY